MLFSIRCATCTKTFTTSRKDKATCSAACRQRWYRQRRAMRVARMYEDAARHEALVAATFCPRCKIPLRYCKCENPAA